MPTLPSDLVALRELGSWLVLVWLVWLLVRRDLGWQELLLGDLRATLTELRGRIERLEDTHGHPLDVAAPGGPGPTPPGGS